MKFKLTCKYQISKSDYITEHDQTRVIEAVDAPMAIQEFLSEITSKAQGIITMVKIEAAIDH